MNIDGTKRANFHSGQRTKIAQVHDQAGDTLTERVVQNILINPANHPRGIKVQLNSGYVGRAKQILET